MPRGVYDEKAKIRNIRYLQKSREQVRLTVPKGTNELWKAYASTKGVSMTKLVKDMMDAAIEADGFVYKKIED